MAQPSKGQKWLQSCFSSCVYLPQAICQTRAERTSTTLLDKTTCIFMYNNEQVENWKRKKIENQLNTIGRKYCSTLKLLFELAGHGHTLRFHPIEPESVLAWDKLLPIVLKSQINYSGQIRLRINALFLFTLLGRKSFSLWNKIDTKKPPVMDRIRIWKKNCGIVVHFLPTQTFFFYTYTFLTRCRGKASSSLQKLFSLPVALFALSGLTKHETTE